MRKIDKEIFIDFLGFVSIGLTSLLYVFFRDIFAEIHIDLSFLNFPIFIGEILLFFCLCLVFAKKEKKYFLPLKRYRYFVISYTSFILLKALLGYLEWGPLALRHAAMFYYPIFIFFGYIFFRKEFLPWYLRVFLVMFIIITLNKLNYVSHWGSSLFLLGIILAVSIGSRILRYFILSLLFISTPYVSFFSTARMIILGNLAAIVFFMLCLLFMSKIGFKNKVIICLFVIVISIICYSLTPNRARLQSIFNISAIYTGFKENMSVVNERINNHTQFRVDIKRKVHIFNPTTTTTDIVILNRHSPLLITKLWDAFCVFFKRNLLRCESEYKRYIKDISLLRDKYVFNLKQSDRYETKKHYVHYVEETPNVSRKSAMKGAFNKTKNKNIKIYHSNAGMKRSKIITSSQHNKKMRSTEHRMRGEIKPAQNDVKIVYRSDNCVNGKRKIKGKRETKDKNGKLIKLANKKKFNKTVRKTAVSSYRDISIVNKADNNRDSTNSISRYKEIKISKEGKSVKFYLNNNSLKSNLSEKNIKKITKKKDHFMKEKVGKHDSYVVSHLKRAKVDKYKIGNILFRLFIWHDVIENMKHMGIKILWGEDFGKPFISPSLEALHWAEGEWSRDGWIAVHNSYLNMIYRAGIVGVGFILFIIISFFKMVRRFVMIHSYIGILLCTIFVVWFVAANFLLIFEMPYTAIPIWSLYGVTLAYCKVNDSKE